MSSYLPDPLHPAMVHFPVVLVLMGAAAALVAVFWRQHYVPALAALLLIFGSIGAWVALATGRSDGGLLESSSPALESLVESHESWAERTLALAIAAATVAVLAWVLGRIPKVGRALAVGAAVVALAASYCVFETGHRGGALVFKHGAGVRVSPTAVSAPAPGPSPAAGDRK